MKNTNTITFAIFILMNIAYQNALALTCPLKDNAKSCPISGVTLLDETYPTQAFVISNKASINSAESSLMTQKFINKVIKSYDYQNIPQIILPINSLAEFNKFVRDTKSYLIEQKVSEEKINKIISQFTFSEMPNFTWQQDWFEAFVNLSTGTPELRQIERYKESELKVSKLSEASKSCGISPGEILKSDRPINKVDPRTTDQSIEGAEMGGNIEGAPGGFCLLGDNQGKQFKKNVCRGEGNIITIKTSWLNVGHVDEILKVIPTNFHDGRPLECEFSVMGASPIKGIELLKQAATSQEKFMSIDQLDENINEKEVRKNRSNMDIPAINKICSYVEKAINNRGNDMQKIPAIRGVFLKLIFNTAKVNAGQLESIVDKQKICADNIDKISNLEMYQALIEVKNTYDLNIAIDESIKTDMANIKIQILNRLPQCAAFYTQIEAPDVFFGSQLIENPSTRKLELPSPGTVNSMLPNPTNGVLMNKTLLFSDSGNSTFNRYMSEQMKAIKMKADFITTWDYAHVGNGNIHCSSHSITHCKPNSKR